MYELPLLIKSSEAGRFLFAGYIDPGTGSILIQYLIAAMLGGAVYFRKFLLRFFSSLKKFLCRKD
jgi:hypothetical protein